MAKLSIIIPCYNEAESLPTLFEVSRNAFGKEKKVECIFVNNGSTDNSAAVFAKLLLLNENSFATLVNIPVNKGYGYGILQGLYQAGGQVLSWTHADLQTDLRDVINAFRKHEPALTEGLIMVKGKRMGRNFFDVLFTTGMSAIASVLLSTRLSDINAQPKIFNRSLFEKMQDAPVDFSLDLYLLHTARQEGIKIESFPVFFTRRNFGEAKGGGSLKAKIKLTKRTFKYIFELRNRIKNSY